MRTSSPRRSVSFTTSSTWYRCAATSRWWRYPGRRAGTRSQPPAVIIGVGGHEHPCVRSLQRQRRNSRALQRFPRQLQQDPLLRIEVLGLSVRNAEEVGVEILDVVQKRSFEGSPAQKMCRL